MSRIHHPKSSSLGISTLVNLASSTLSSVILRCPVDREPCTTVFCKVHDSAEIGGVEEVQIVKEGVTYNLSDESTFARASLSALDEIVSENEDGQLILKVFLSFPTLNPPLHFSFTTASSTSH